MQLQCCTSQAAVYIQACPDTYNVRSKSSKEPKVLSVVLGKMEMITMLTCLIPVRNMLSSLRDYFNTENWTRHMVFSSLKINISKINVLVLEKQRTNLKCVHLPSHWIWRNLKKWQQTVKCWCFTSSTRQHIESARSITSFKVGSQD